jgi:hypothetical protein
MLIKGEWKHMRFSQGIGENIGSNIPCPYELEIRKSRHRFNDVSEPSVELVGTILMQEGREIWSVCCGFWGNRTLNPELFAHSKSKEHWSKNILP